MLSGKSFAISCGAASATLSPARRINHAVFFLCRTRARCRLRSHNVRHERVQAWRHRVFSHRGRHRSGGRTRHSSAPHAVFALCGCLRLVARFGGRRFSLSALLSQGFSTYTPADSLTALSDACKLNVALFYHRRRAACRTGRLVCERILQHPRAAAGWRVCRRSHGLWRRAVSHGPDFASRGGKRSHARRCHLRRLAPKVSVLYKFHQCDPPPAWRTSDRRLPFPRILFWCGRDSAALFPFQAACDLANDRVWRRPARAFCREQPIFTDLPRSVL